MAAYYNEIDPKAAAWLRELIKQGHIAPGDVDERSIVDVTAEDLRDYTQCHFFAGIGVWSYALRQAGWPDESLVWTGSCPCQPFSVSGRRGGFSDNRHLWPYWFVLIAECQPPVVFGEQVASPDGLKWFDTVSFDMESQDYAIAAADLCAAGVGAPHIRQRLYFVADTDSRQRYGIAGGERCERNRPTTGRQQSDGQSECGSKVGALADDAIAGWSRRRSSQASEGAVESGRLRPVSGFWADADWIACRDGKHRPVEPGTFPLAHGAAARVGRLRGYGNAIVAPLATTFIQAYRDMRR